MFFEILEIHEACSLTMDNLCTSIPLCPIAFTIRLHGLSPLVSSKGVSHMRSIPAICESTRFVLKSVYSHIYSLEKMHYIISYSLEKM